MNIQKISRNRKNDSLCWLLCGTRQMNTSVQFDILLVGVLLLWIFSRLRTLFNSVFQIKVCAISGGKQDNSDRDNVEGKYQIYPGR